MQKITPFLWFHQGAKNAVDYYLSVFKNARVDHISPLGPAGGHFVKFSLEDVEFYALDGGPTYTMSPAVSFFVTCKDQAEIDYLWDKLGQGGEIHSCGWLTDQFGVTWQISPEVLGSLMSDPQKVGKVMEALMGMVKLDIAGLQAAYDSA